MATESSMSNVSLVGIIAGAFMTSSLLFAVILCAWCRKKWGKILERGHCRLSDSSNSEISPQRHMSTEFIIFPPPLLSEVTSVSTNEIVFEPLPEILNRSQKTSSHGAHPARFMGSRKISVQDWFDNLPYNFPRSRLKYLQEVGTGWYGQAVEGEAYSISSGEQKTRVVVKILRVDASAADHMHFLHEAKPFRDLRHPNLLLMLGRCLEVHPFLLIMEHCPVDLKSFLIEHRKSPEVLLNDGVVLRMACNIASALQHMHENGYVITDIAAHSCMVTSNLVVKLGDYGIAFQLHKDDFYCLGDIYFPLRWCAPETLHCTEKTVETKEITREANIWSFGILLWELLEFAKQPYMEYSDDEVLKKVIIETALRLEQPKTPCVHKDMMFRVMQLCWLPANHRPTVQKLTTLLNYLYDNKDAIPDSAVFESRWNSIQPPFIRDYSLSLGTISREPRKFETDFRSRAESNASRENDYSMSSDYEPGLVRNKYPSNGSLSLGFEVELGADISPSLQNLRGSLEDLIIASNSFTSESESNCASKQYSDSTVKENVTQYQVAEAIRDLDNVLNGELTSSETSKCTTPTENQSDNPIGVLDGVLKVDDEKKVHVKADF